MSKLFVYDIETTGRSSYKNAIHQIAGKIIINGVIKEEFNFKLAPHMEAVIEDEALAVSHVTKEEIMEYPPYIVAHKQILTMLGKYCDKFKKTDKFFLVGYNNASFDDDFMRAFFNRCNDKFFGSWFWADPIDVRVLAANYLMEERHLLENFQQRTVAKYLNIEVDETKLHDAQYDIFLTWAIFEIVRNGRNLTREANIEVKAVGIPEVPSMEVFVEPELFQFTAEDADRALIESGLIIEEKQPINKPIN